MYRTLLLAGLLLTGLALTGYAQTSVESAMLASIEKQKASVRRQTMGAVPQATLPEPGSWFTTPWPGEPIRGIPSGMTPPTLAATQIGNFGASDCDPMPQDQVGALIRDAAGREGLKEDLISAVIQRESAFKPCAVSPKGAQGLMQLMPGTAKDLGVDNVFDPKQNIDAGTRYLKQLVSRYNGNLELALSAYNAGPGRVDKAGGVPNIPETKTYVIEILNKLLF